MKNDNNVTLNNIRRNVLSKILLTCKSESFVLIFVIICLIVSYTPHIKHKKTFLFMIKIKLCMYYFLN